MTSKKPHIDIRSTPQGASADNNLRPRSSSPPEARDLNIEFVSNIASKHTMMSAPTLNTASYNRNKNKRSAHSGTIASTNDLDTESNYVHIPPDFNSSSNSSPTLSSSIRNAHSAAPASSPTVRSQSGPKILKRQRDSPVKSYEQRIISDLKPVLPEAAKSTAPLTRSRLRESQIKSPAQTEKDPEKDHDNENDKDSDSEEDSSESSSDPSSSDPSSSCSPASSSETLSSSASSSSFPPQPTSSAIPFPSSHDCPDYTDAVLTADTPNFTRIAPPCDSQSWSVTAPETSENTDWFYKNCGLKLAASTRPIDNLDLIVYCSGSGSAGDNSAGAAIVVRHVASSRCFIAATFSAVSSKEVGEWLAINAALKVAETLAQHKRIAVITDNNDIYSGIGLLHSSIRNSKVKSLIESARSLHRKINKYVIVARMQTRATAQTDSPNLAADAARRAREDQKLMRLATRCSADGKNVVIPQDVETNHDGMQTEAEHIVFPSNNILFPKWITMFSRKPTYKLANSALSSQMQCSDNTISDFEAYLRLRRLPARMYVPAPIRPFWSALVKQKVNNVITAEERDTRDSAMLELLSLPNRWLPANVDTDRVCNHFRDGTPFAMPTMTKKSSATDKQRLERAVQRKARNHDLKGAVNILRSQAENGQQDTSFQEKVTALKKKFVKPRSLDNLKHDIGPDDQVRAHFADLRDKAGCDSLTTLPALSTEAVTKTLKGMKRTSAQAIDGWAKGLMDFIVEEDAQFAGNLAYLTQMVLRGQFGLLVMRCIRTARLVPIPKSEGGVRPIAVSGFFMKLAGGAAMLSGRGRLEPWQYAERGIAQGTKFVVHQCRALLAKGYTILKFDMRNAFGEMLRALCAKAISQSSSAWLNLYFDQFYLHIADGVVYGPDSNVELIQMSEGVRQGDATSAFIFQKALDIIVSEIVDACESQGVELRKEHIFCYMDDVTFATSNVHHVAEITRIVRDTFARFGLMINERSSKSSGISNQIRQDVICSETGYTVMGPDGDFELLGASLSNSPGPFLQRYKQRQNAFFELIKWTELHPALTYSILRICGNPRIKYLCSVMPPTEQLLALANWFDSEVISILDGATMLHGRIQSTPNAVERVYASNGLGFTCYTSAAETLYAASQIAAMTDSTRSGWCLEPATTISHMAGQHPFIAPTVETPSDPPSLSAAAPPQTNSPEEEVDTIGVNIGHLWLFYTGREDDLTPKEYKIALSLRLGCLPSSVNLPVACRCQQVISSAAQMIHHAMACPEGKMLKDSGISFTSRHEVIKREALLKIPRMYGIGCVAEPKTFQSYYGSGKRGRPDVQYESFPPIVIDLSVVHTSLDKQEGYSAQQKAQQKENKHGEAVRAGGATFVPFIMETEGLLHYGAVEVIKALSRQLAYHMRHSFINDMKRTLSVALAKEKMKAVCMALKMVSGGTW